MSYDYSTLEPTKSEPSQPRTGRDRPDRRGRRPLDADAIAPLDAAISDLWPKLVATPDSREYRRLLVVGADDGAGATTVSLMAAAGLAQHLFTSTLLIETHFRRPRLAHTFDLPGSFGLRPVLEGRTDVASAIVDSEIPFLHVLPAGEETREFPGAFMRPGARPVLEYLKARFTHLVFDAPPLTTEPDARLLLDEVDSVVVVAAAGETPKRELARTIEIVRDSDAEFLGVVFNRFSADAPEWLAPSRTR